MSTSPTPPTDPEGSGAPAPDFVQENAMRIASESLTRYDQASDTYHCSYGPPVPAVTVHDAEREVLVRVEPGSGNVIGFSIPNFKQWHSAHADEDGSFEVVLPPVWPLGDDAGSETDG